MDWMQEVATSAIWVAKAYAITVLLFVASVAGLVRFTRWGRQFWALSGAYFSPRRSWRPLLALALILFITLCSVRLDVLFSNWYNSMYTALQKLDAKAFWIQMAVFSVLATVHVLRALFDYFIQQRFAIHWRVWLNEQLLSRWLERRAYYRTLYLDQPADNPDQRIQQDIDSFVSNALSLSMGVVDALVSSLTFTIILWDLSATLSLFGVDIPRAMVFLVFAYVLIATVFAVKIGRPLVSLNFFNERLNADYRYALVRLREYAESIAFYCGEKVEGFLLRNAFGRVIDNVWKIVFRSLKFQGFNLAVSQTAVVFPLIIQAPRFFSKQITLGDMMQTSQAFGTLQRNLSFFRTAYDTFAGFRATQNRLTGFVDAIDNANALPEPEVQAHGTRVGFGDVTIRTPAGTALLNRASFEIDSGDALLIRGRSGVGKTTLLRCIAGLWPYSEGRITRPDSDVMFLSQRPYLPLGSLRDALYYPAAVPLDAHADSLARQVLADVQLGHLQERLDEVTDWGRILSLGEQQRLAFGRLLLGQPQAAFLDEASSALDEGLEDAMYRLLRTRLPQAVIVSVGHRSTLLRHHSHCLELTGGGQWQFAAV